MRKIKFTLPVIVAFMLFSIASCGVSSEDQYSEEDFSYDEYSDADYASYDYDDEEKGSQKGSQKKGSAKAGQRKSSASAPAVTAFKPFPIYTDGRSPDNHYIPSGYMGDYSDVSLDNAWFDNPHSGTTCMKITYSNKISQGARWVGLYWLNPANNWGDRQGGYDLTGAMKLSFWARGDLGGERIEEFKMGGLQGEYSDSDIAGIGPVRLSTEWTKYEIDLRGKDLSYISGGFCFSTNLDVNPEGVTFYLDDIRYE